MGFDIMKKQIASLLFSSAIAFPALATTPADNAFDALNQSINNAEMVISQVEAQDAINRLTASIAEAELTLSVAYAEDSLRQVQGQEAMNSLLASVANAELSISVADSIDAIDAVSDDQMLAELDAILPGASADTANDMIVAVVSERPMLASAIQESATALGLNDAMVASAIINGLGSTEATAAGQ